MSETSSRSDSDRLRVSCLMVTLPVAQRLCFLQRSVAAYCRQTHRNKELVIVVDQGTAAAKSAIAAHVASLGRDDIRLVDVRGKLSLGALRNLSRESARGDVLCQWDDDDLHHPRRVEQQLAALIKLGGQASHLQEVMHFFARSRLIYCTNWHATEAGGMPGTLMFRRSAQMRYPETGPSSRRGEDSVVVSQLRQRGELHALAGAPHLYVYVNHGGNTWADDHHEMLATRLGISRGLLLRREAQLREGLRPFDFGRGGLTVQGNNGPAFTLGGEHRD